jgi:hypothetical protein
MDQTNSELQRIDENNERATQLALGLRKFADMIAENPALMEAFRWSEFEVAAYVTDQTLIGDYARAAAAAGAEVIKDFPPDGSPDRHFRLYSNFGRLSVRLHCERSVVCERVVTGTETVTKTVPDPAALAAVPQVEVTEEVEKVEWRCKPLLASDAPVQLLEA